MQMNKRGLTFSAAFILAIKNNDLLANPSSTYWASRASSAWAICSLSVFCCFSLTHPSFPFSPSHSASFTPCRPPESERQAFETLNLTKLIFRRRRRTTAFPPFFLRVSSWDSADILRWKKYVIFGVVVGGGVEHQRVVSTRSAKYSAGNPPPTLELGSSQWALTGKTWPLTLW